MKFQPGQSGNPARRKVGAVGKQLTALRKRGDEVIELVVKQALEGCLQSQKLIIDRMLPPLKPVGTLNPIKGYQDAVTVVEKMMCILDAVAAGKYPAQDANTLINLLIHETEIALGVDQRLKFDDEFSFIDHHTQAQRVAILGKRLKQCMKEDAG